jgi:hypothetical protein
MILSHTETEPAIAAQPGRRTVNMVFGKSLFCISQTLNADERAYWTSGILVIAAGHMSWPRQARFLAPAYRR